MATIIWTNRRNGDKMTLDRLLERLEKWRRSSGPIITGEMATIIWTNRRNGDKMTGTTLEK
jgi:hypothetical protein